MRDFRIPRRWTFKSSGFWPHVVVW
jgi:hypothetical protein